MAETIKWRISEGNDGRIGKAFRRSLQNFSFFELRLYWISGRWLPDCSLSIHQSAASSRTIRALLLTWRSKSREKQAVKRVLFSATCSKLPAQVFWMANRSVVGFGKFSDFGNIRSFASILFSCENNLMILLDVVWLLEIDIGPKVVATLYFPEFLISFWPIPLSGIGWFSLKRW